MAPIDFLSAERVTGNDFTIRTATRGGIDIAVEWAAKEGSNPGIHNADCYYPVDPNGFFIGFFG